MRRRRRMLSEVFVIRFEETLAGCRKWRLSAHRLRQRSAILGSTETREDREIKEMLVSTGDRSGARC
jgi:hypothetical protein